MDMKKFISLILATAMLFSIQINIFAQNNNTGTVAVETGELSVAAEGAPEFYKYGSRSIYNTLTDEEKTVYDQLLKICELFVGNYDDVEVCPIEETGGSYYVLKNRTDNFNQRDEYLNTMSCTTDAYSTIYSKFRKDNPQYYWLYDKACTLGNDFLVVIDQFFKDKDMRKEYDQLLEGNIATVINDANQVNDENRVNNTFLKLKRVYNRLAGMATYTSAKTSDSVSIKSIFDGNNDTACCHEGYTKSMQLILCGLKIPNTYVEALGVNNTGSLFYHSWNTAEIDGKYYFFDLAWDDGAVITYDYFSKGLNDLDENLYAHNKYHYFGLEQYVTFPLPETISETKFANSVLSSEEEKQRLYNLFEYLCNGVYEKYEYNVSKQNDFYPILNSDGSAINYYYCTQIEFEDTYKEFVENNPKYYWLMESCPINVKNKLFYISVKTEYASGATRRNIDNGINSVIGAVDTCADIYSQVKTVHDKICELASITTSSDDKSDGIFNVFDGDNTTLSTYEGYAKSFKLILDLLNIPNEYIKGSINGKSYAWNAVKIGDSYYLFDVAKNDGDTITYNYFAKGINDFDEYTASATDIHYTTQSLPNISTNEHKNMQEPTSTNIPKFYCYGSDYGYKDLAKRSSSEERQRVYNVIKECCENFAGNYDELIRHENVKMDNGTEPTLYFLKNDSGTDGGYKNSTSLTMDECIEVYNMFRNDNPQYYWLFGSIIFVPETQNFYIAVQPDYVVAEDRKAIDDTLSANIDGLVNSININESDYLQLKNIHDSLAAMTSYGYNSEGKPLDTIEAHSIVGMFDGDNKADCVCEAYAKSLQLILNAVGIPNVYVTGNAGEAHAWNIVQLGEKNYLVDLTWDDSKDADGNDTISYKYFARGTSDFDEFNSGIAHTADTPDKPGRDFLYSLPEIVEKQHHNNYTYFPEHFRNWYINDWGVTYSNSLGEVVTEQTTKNLTERQPFALQSSITAKNADSIKEGDSLIAAIYDTNGLLIETKIFDLFNNEKISLVFQGYNGKVDKVMLTVWNMKNLSPIAEAVTIE